jgi:hypothetical protein
METTILNVLDYCTDRLLGTIEADTFRSDLLLHFPGIHGWRAWECLTKKERQAMGLQTEAVIFFTRTRA